MKAVVTFLATLAVTMSLCAQTAPEPEACLARTDSSRVASAEHNGVRYDFTSEVCKAQFLSDPDRYAQLYDALRELEAESGKPVAPPQPSLVPS